MRVRNATTSRHLENMIIGWVKKSKGCLSRTEMSVKQLMVCDQAGQRVQHRARPKLTDFLPHHVTNANLQVDKNSWLCSHSTHFHTPAHDAVSPVLCWEITSIRDVVSHGRLVQPRVQAHHPDAAKCGEYTRGRGQMTSTIEPAVFLVFLHRLVSTFTHRQSRRPSMRRHSDVPLVSITRMRMSSVARAVPGFGCPFRELHACAEQEPVGKRK
jgi:hypothetical protein